MTTATMNRIAHERPALHKDIFKELRQRGFGLQDALQMATIECCECGGRADHWHTMTGTTADDHEHSLMDLIDGVVLHSDMPMACGHECEISLQTGEWYPHCEDCEPRDCEDCGGPCETNDHGDWVCTLCDMVQDAPHCPECGEPMERAADPKTDGEWVCMCQDDET